MNLSEYIYVTSRPYSSLLQEISISGKLFQSKRLFFNMQMQTQSNWCWAATSTSVSHFYWFWSTWAQCRVANGELGHSDCCNSPVPSACNMPWYLDKALTRTNNFVSITGQVSFQQVRDEINAGRPVGARIGWNGGGGHFMVIYGYSRFFGMEYFDIDDPIYGKSHLAVSILPVIIRKRHLDRYLFYEELFQNAHNIPDPRRAGPPAYFARLVHY